MEKRIVLGSGKLYATEFTGTIPQDSVIETDDNLLGLISGGASLSYTPSFYEAKDDLGIVSKKFITEEEVILTSGILTWNAKTLDKLVGTGTLTETETKRTLKIGGMGNYNGKQYVLRFVHEDAIDGYVKVTIVGSNEAGFEIQFQKDSETIINAEFKAQPHDDNGTLIIYEEEIKAKA